MAKDVIVVVQRDAMPKEKESLDILLISTAGAYPVKEYRDIKSVEEVYGTEGVCPNPKIFRKAVTLLNQNKTTLASTSINKFKIVSFDEPRESEAQPASLTIEFEDTSMVSNIESGRTLWVCIGEDCKFSITTKSEITNMTQLTSLFNKKTITKGNTVYTASISGQKIIFTAGSKGKTENIIEKIKICGDEDLTEVIETKQNIEYIEGKDRISAANNLIETIKQFQIDEDNDWYIFMTDKEDDEYVLALSKYAETTEPSESELDTGIEDNRKFYMGQTSNKNFKSLSSRAAVIYTEDQYLNEEPDACYVGNVGPFYPNSVTWKFKRPQDGNAPSEIGTKTISLPKLTSIERDRLIENNVNFLVEEYKRQYVKNGTCLNGEYIDVVLGGDWIAKRMRDLLYEILLENANINYDDAGFGQVAIAVLQTLSEAVSYNIVAINPESGKGLFDVQIPKYTDSTEEQRRNRIMPDIVWEAQLAGAIHKVKVKGILRASM